MNRTFMLTALLFTLTLAGPPAAAATLSGAAAPATPAVSAAATEDQNDELLERARDLIEEGRFDRAIDPLNRVIAAKGSKTDAALYWKAYSLAKLNQRAEALTTISDLNKQFASS